MKVLVVHRQEDVLQNIKNQLGHWHVEAYGNGLEGLMAAKNVGVRSNSLRAGSAGGYGYRNGQVPKKPEPKQTYPCDSVGRGNGNRRTLSDLSTSQCQPYDDG